MSLNDSALLRRSIENVVRDVVKEETRSCFRVYKAIVVTAPNAQTKRCVVRLVGLTATQTLSIPYSSDCSGVSVGDAVWVGVPFSNFKNAVVWQKIDFS